MKKLLFLFLILFTTQIAVAQPPEYFVDNWYLHSFSFSDEEVFINTLGLTEGPTLITESDFTLHGTSFCNNYSGNYEYIEPGPIGVNEMFIPRNIVRETENCGDFEAMETHFFIPFLNEDVADIYFIDLPGTEKMIVLQYFSFPGYQVYKNFPALNISDNKSIKDLLVFPNPAQNKLIIHSAIHNFESVSITDINGRIVMNSVNNNSKEIDVSNFNAGMYFITIQSSEGNITKKFIKN
ncbi:MULTISPECIES: T9SS type A sorting domain-containing protein [Aequorivita]|uniref:T9SS type A sorting domain-containing protein n=2 Tax=Aequorivita TaxID=153265 RepID=A0AB35YSK8_9FLAO|nr:T9SS type A sorting domain-containing protein [Aequorivita sp. Ant34-E75]WGF93660.1 T9SS type A sorting domain-containing protein [Aequorivita sp. Ant34-E75]